MNQDTKVAPSAGFSKKKALVYAAVAFVAGIGMGWILFAPVPVAKEGDKVSDKPLVLAAGENSVVVDDQLPGNKVEIKDVKLREAGWVAIHEADGGALGKVLGAQWFPAGESTGTVELLRPTVDAGTYFAVLHSDNSSTEGRIFDPKVNVALLDDAGEPISFQFLTTVTPAAQ